VAVWPARYGLGGQVPGPQLWQPFLPSMVRHTKCGWEFVRRRRQLKEVLAKMPNVKLYTPMANELSAGIVCFDVNGLRADQVVDQFRKKKIVASVTPYRTWYARLAPSFLTSPAEVETTLAAVRELRT
jgi:selenocysteine lyase/cysteine desulfurase